MALGVFMIAVGLGSTSFGIWTLLTNRHPFRRTPLGGTRLNGAMNVVLGVTFVVIGVVRVVTI
jgi:hypothetical protein